MSITLYRYTERCDGISCPMDCDKCGMDDEMYWELLEEQHAHDVVISGAQEGAEEHEKYKRIANVAIVAVGGQGAKDETTDKGMG